MVSRIIVCVLMHLEMHSLCILRIQYQLSRCKILCISRRILLRLEIMYLNIYIYIYSLEVHILFILRLCKILYLDTMDLETMNFEIHSILHLENKYYAHSLEMHSLYCISRPCISKLCIYICIVFYVSRRNTMYIVSRCIYYTSRDTASRDA